MKIYNAKNEEISGVIIKPYADIDLSPNEYFIGSMDADELYAITFDVFTETLTENQTYDIDFIISFKQDNNYYTTAPISSSFTVIESNNSNGFETVVAGIIFIIAMIIILFFIYKRKKR